MRANACPDGSISNRQGANETGSATPPIEQSHLDPSLLTAVGHQKMAISSQLNANPPFFDSALKMPITRGFAPKPHELFVTHWNSVAKMPT